MGQVIKLLIVEKDKTLISSIINSLKENGYRPEYETVTTAPSFEKTLIDYDCDVILFDEPSDDFDVFTALAILRGCGSDIPFICICDKDKREKSVRAMMSGARDYIFNNDLTRLIPVIKRELNDTHLRKEKELALGALATSEKKYKDLVETSPDVIYILTPEGTISSLNPVFEEVTGWPLDEIIGKNISTLIHPDDSPAIIERFRREMSGETVETQRARIRIKSGDYVTAEFKSAPIIEKGKIVGVRGSARDITERVEAEEILLKSEERYRTLVESSPSAIAIHSDGKLVYVNESCLDLMRATREGVIGKSVIDFVHADYREIVSERMKEALETGITAEAIEEKFLRPDGTTVEVEVISTPIIYEGKPALQTVFWDITEHKQIEELLAESEERYKTLQNNIPVGIFRSDAGANGKIVSANPALAEMFGYKSVDELLNVHVADFYLNPEERAEFTKKMNEIGVVNSYEVEFKRVDEAIFWGSISATAVKGADGKVSYFDGILQEITERKKIEDALASSEKTFRSLYESNQALADVTDLDALIEVISRSVRTLLGGTDSTLFLVNKEENVLIPINVFPKDEYDAIMAFKIKIGEGLSGRVAETGEGFYLNYGEEDKYSIHVPGTNPEEEDIESVIAAPMFEDNGEVLGVITIGLVGGKFEKDDLAKLNFFARQAEIAIKRARFYDVLKESEEKYRGVVDKSLVGLYITQNNKLKFANIRLMEMFGYDDPVELIDTDIMEFIAPESREIVAEQVRLRDSGSKEVAHYEFKGVKKDGTIFEVEALGSRISYGGAPAIQGSLIDITERKRAEAALKRDRQAFALIAEAAVETTGTSGLSQHILDGLIKILDFDSGSIRLFDEKSETLIPVAINEDYDKPIKDIVKTLHIGEGNCIAARVARTREPIFAPDVEQHEISTTYKERLKALGVRSIISWPLLNADKTVLGVIQLGASTPKEMSKKEQVFFKNFADTFATALGKKRADEEMFELRRAKDTLTDLVVHDIKNISSTMYSWLEMMNEGILGSLNDEQTEAMQRIVRQNEELFQLSEEMLDIARAEEGEISLDKKPYALDDQVLEVIEYYLPGAEKESKVIRRQLTGEPIIVDADEARMKRVIANLIQNAVQFAPANSGKVFVALREDTKNETVVFKVTDNGPGIPKEFQSLIFEKYSQIELKSRGFKKGYGLGLTYCKMIIETHDGDIKVESDGENGTSFIFTLPLYVPDSK